MNTSRVHPLTFLSPQTSVMFGLIKLAIKILVAELLFMIEKMYCKEENLAFALHRSTVAQEMLHINSN